MRLEIGSGWFGNRLQRADAQLEEAGQLGFSGVAVLPGDPLPRFAPDRALQVRTPASFTAVCWDSLASNSDSSEPGVGRLLRDSGALLGPAESRLRALRPSALVISGGFTAGSGRVARGERILARLRSGEAVGPGDEALEALDRAAGADPERQLEGLARQLHALHQALPGIRLAVHAEASPAALVTPELLQLLFEDPAFASVGYWHDTAACEARAALGREDPGVWLDSFGPRMVGASLHDYAGGRNHLPPGFGVVDWALVREYLPRKAHRVLSIAPSYPVAALREAREALGALGIR